MNRPLPMLAVLLGLAGLIPFAAFGLYALSLNGARAGFALAAYAAVILSFLGGVHWGFALDDPSSVAERARLSLGVVPSLIGWVGLLITMAIGVNVGLSVLVAGFAGTVIVEHRAVAKGLMPRGYMRLRYGLTAVVGTILVLVIILRLLGTQLALP